MQRKELFQNVKNKVITGSKFSAIFSRSFSQIPVRGIRVPHGLLTHQPPKATFILMSLLNIANTCLAELPNPLYFDHNKTHFCLAIDIAKGESSRAQIAWDFFQKMGDSIMAGKYGNVSESCLIPSQKTSIWESAICDHAMTLTRDLFGTTQRVFEQLIIENSQASMPEFDEKCAAIDRNDGIVGTVVGSVIFAILAIGLLGLLVYSLRRDSKKSYQTIPSPATDPKQNEDSKEEQFVTDVDLEKDIVGGYQNSIPLKLSRGLK